MRQSDSTEKLSICLKKLEPFKAKAKEEILKDPYMQDIIETWI
jgi:hypothetical protein